MATESELVKRVTEKVLAQIQQEKSKQDFAPLGRGGGRIIYEQLTNSLHITIVPHAYSSIGQGTWNYQGTDGQYTREVWENSSDTDGDNIEYDLYLTQGIWTLRALYRSQNPHGIMGVYIDDVKQGEIDEWESGLGTKNKVGDVTLNISSSGTKTLKLQVDGKNPSGAGYMINFSVLSIWR